MYMNMICYIFFTIINIKSVFSSPPPHEDQRASPALSTACCATTKHTRPSRVEVATDCLSAEHCPNIDTGVCLAALAHSSSGRPAVWSPTITESAPTHRRPWYVRTVQPTVLVDGAAHCVNIIASLIDQQQQTLHGTRETRLHVMRHSMTSGADCQRHLGAGFGTTKPVGPFLSRPITAQRDHFYQSTSYQISGGI